MKQEATLSKVLRMARVEFRDSRQIDLCLKYPSVSIHNKSNNLCACCTIHSIKITRCSGKQAVKEHTSLGAFARYSIKNLMSDFSQALLEFK